MSNPSSKTLDKVIGNVVEEVLRERAEERNQETTLEVMPEEIKFVVEEGEVRALYYNKGEEAFRKHLTKKCHVEKRLRIARLALQKVSGTKRMGMEPGKRALVKKF